ncbi:unnamed protein product [Lactuca virosa]|uniref:Factor of DNA methylation 1-5/IDN2 domain-containing protein n=1 Tax=Lactuca virosa TaxID=75947 RepID=A0AAU9LI51_9ASTR|nr:unnamed protein product [Lactuca virosa]
MKEICASGRVYIGVKRMGGLDAKPFIVDAKKRCLSREDTVKFLSIWEDHLRDPSWHPFKVITIGDDYKAQKIIDLMVRPLVGTPCPPIIPRKTCKFFGHLSIDRIKINQREMEEAVSMSHFSQLNTIEYDMAMEWFLMQSKSKKWWEMVHKVRICHHFYKVVHGSVCGNKPCSFECLEMLKLKTTLKLQFYTFTKQTSNSSHHITVHFSFDDFDSCFDDEDEDELFGLDGCTCYMNNCSIRGEPNVLNRPIHVKSEMSGKYVNMKDGHPHGESMQKLPDIEARLPLQIWVTEKTNGLLNEETGTNGVLNLEEFMRNKNKRSYRTIKKLDFTTILDPHVLILDHIIHIQSAASLFPLQHPSSSSFLFPLKQNHLPQPAASLSPLDHRIHHH